MLWLVVSVVGAHLWALHSMGESWREAHSIKPMLAPVFTRTLMPSAPPQAPAMRAPESSVKKLTNQAIVQDSAMLSATQTATIEFTKVLEMAPSAAPIAPLQTASGARAAAALAAESILAALTGSPSAAIARGTSSSALNTTGTAGLGGTGSFAVESWPTDTRLNYRVGGYFNGDLTGSATVLWLRQGEKYQVVMDIGLGIVGVKMTSEGRVKADTLWPERYEETLPKKRSLKLSDEFITLDDGSSIARPAGVQDTVSQFVELTQRFVSGRASLEAGSLIQIPLARPGGFNDWTYDVLPYPKLPTRISGDYAEIDAYHLKPRPVPNARGPITMDFWLAPSLQFFPVKVKITLSPQAFVELDLIKIEQR